MVILNHCIYIEEFEDTKEIIKIRISKNNIQRNGQKEKLQKDKQRSTKYAHQSKNRVTRTPTQQVSPVKQELPTLPEHPSSRSGFDGVRVTLFLL
jgi:hypothetical protein